MRRFLRQYGRLTLALAAVLAFCAVLPLLFQQSRAIETGSWGLSFRTEGKAPVGNASADALRRYDAVYLGDETEKKLYLTFDAGYENGCTAPILDALEKHNVKAAFFVVGNYLEQNPDTVCIVSGAQGRNEPCTEAEGMADYLLTKGIPAERILQEREARTTAENLAYSRKLMPEGSSVGIVTNNFHVFRALQIAREQGLEDAVGIAAGAKPFYQLNNILREYLAEIKYLISRIVS